MRLYRLNTGLGPIEGQNTNWYQVSSNWLGTSHDRDNGGIENRYQADGTASNSPHILWTRPTEDNGVVGGSDLSRAGNTFNAGSQYQPRFMNQIIMYGRLYYSPNVYTSGSSDYRNTASTSKLANYSGKSTQPKQSEQIFQDWLYSIMSSPSNYWFGTYYSQDDPNEHGYKTPAGYSLSTTKELFNLKEEQLDHSLSTTFLPLVHLKHQV